MINAATRLLTLAMLATSLGAAAAPLPSPASIDRAAALIEAGSHRFARHHLERALIDPAITAGQRSRAFYLRGYSLFAEGLPVSAAKDYNRALEFNPGNRAALTGLAYLLYRGEGVPRNNEQAMRLYTKAARAGDTSSMVVLGRSLLTGDSVEPDITAARHWLQTASESGHCEAMELLGYSYRSAIAPEPEPELARQWYQRAIESGCDDTVVALGRLLRSGELGEPDYAGAVALFEEAAARDNAAAQEALGYALLYGEGVAVDYTSARGHLVHAASANRSGAYRALAYLHEAGLGVKASKAQAERWLTGGARGGDAESQLRLAELLQSQRRYSEVGYWLREAAASGEQSARVLYSLFLSSVPEDSLRDAHLARQQADLALASDSEDPLALRARARVAALLEDTDAIEQWQNKAMSAAQASGFSASELSQLRDDLNKDLEAR